MKDNESVTAWKYVMFPVYLFAFALFIGIAIAAIKAGYNIGYELFMLTVKSISNIMP